MNIQEQLRAAIAAAEASAAAPTAPRGWDVVETSVPLDEATLNAVDEAHQMSPSEPEPVATDVTNYKPVNTLTQKVVQIKNLDEKAVLVSVKRRMYSPYKLDAEATEEYGVGNTNKHLFEGRDNRVKEAISKYSDVYTFVKDHTVPWSTGVEMLNMMYYMDFTSALRDKITAADAAVRDLITHWDFEVAKDIQRIKDICARKGIPDRSNPTDYPPAEVVESRFSIEVRYMPVPKVDNFDPRLGLSDEDKASLQKQLDDASTNATTHVIRQMMEPMQRAVEKLKINIGTDGSIFRDSLIDNMVDVADRMNRVNLSDDPAITEAIKDLQSLVGIYANNKDVLRSTQSVRAKAATQIDDLMSKMAGLV